jgi:hypothetical protein
MALNQDSTGHDWKSASPDEQMAFCRGQCATIEKATDPQALHETLTILYNTQKRSICDIPLGSAVALITGDFGK